LEGLPDDDVRRLVSTASATRRPSSAVDYVSSVLSCSALVLSARAAGAAEPQARTPSAGRSQWERVPLTSDVELHVRRPLTRDANRRVEKLLDLDAIRAAWRGLARGAAWIV
jgi:hypothetical protein